MTAIGKKGFVIEIDHNVSCFVFNEKHMQILD